MEKKSYNEFVREQRIPFSDYVSGKRTLNSIDDVIVIDRAKYAGNVGSILRHMPILGGQVLFLTDSSTDSPNLPGNKSDANTPRYGRNFVKEVLRVSMAFTRTEFPTTLCIASSLLEVVEFLKTRGRFRMVSFENREVFEEINTGARARLSRLRENYHNEQNSVYNSIVDFDSLYNSPLIGDFSQRMALVFGGESGGLPAEVIKKCQHGIYIPSLLDNYENGSSNKVNDIIEVEETASNVAIPAISGTEILEKAYTYNLSIAVTIVLSERMRRRMSTNITDQGLIQEDKAHCNVHIIATGPGIEPGCVTLNNSVKENEAL